MGTVVEAGDEKRDESLRVSGRCVAVLLAALQGLDADQQLRAVCADLGSGENATERDLLAVVDALGVRSGVVVWNQGNASHGFSSSRDGVRVKAEDSVMGASGAPFCGGPALLPLTVVTRW
jgi:hypothetical protein